MTIKEFDLWCSYRAKHGSLGPVRKYDQMGAIIASTIHNAHSKKSAQFTDFLPYHKEEEIEVDEAGFIAALGNTRVKVGR